MAIDNEELEVVDGNEQVVDDKSTPTDAPVTSKDDLYDSAQNEGVENAIIDELAEKEAITIEDLRRLPGAEGLSDAQLQAQWDAVQKQAGSAGPNAGDQKVDLPFPVYDKDGNKVAKDKVTLEGLLSGDFQLGYNAMGKEQRKALTEVLRNASQGHWNEHRYQTVQSQFKEVNTRYQEAQKQIAEFTSERNQWNVALTALIAGDAEPMKGLVNAYRQALTTSGMVPKGYVPEAEATAQREAEARGNQWWVEVGVPEAFKIAQSYGADPKEVQGAIKYFLENEPVLTQDRINEIIQYDVPMALEQNGYTSSGKPATTANEPTGDVAELKKQVEALTKRLAEGNNTRVQSARNKNKNAPAAGSGSAPGAGDSIPNFKTADDMKKWLRQR